MTQPIQEPNEQRALADQARITRQLARRPGPPISSIPGFDWIICIAGPDMIVADSTPTDFEFAAVSLPVLSTAFEVGPDLTHPMTIKKSGWYLFFLESWPGGTGIVGTFEHGIGPSGAGFFATIGYTTLGPRESFRYDESNPGTDLNPTYGLTTSFGPLFVTANGANKLNVRGWVYHALDTPGTIDWNMSYLSCVSLGPGLSVPDQLYNPVEEDDGLTATTYF